MSSLELQGVWKVFGKHPAVRNVHLSVAEGEMVVLVGPSGCGKTTTLRMVAGLESVSAGTVSISGRDVTRLPPGRRNIGMVFQSYALYPHLSVYRNLMFGAQIRHEPKRESQEHAREVARVLEIEELLDRRPAQLSGGQRQRVALGRVLMRRPDLFLLDEPLSNLDAALRTEVRAELIRLHRRLEATMIYVTHDQVEAMTMADRIGVMSHGILMQVGTPAELYEAPRNQFVASFLGSPRINTFSGRIETASNGPVFRLQGGWLPLPPSWRSLVDALAPDKEVTLGVRPEDWTPASLLAEEGVQGVVDIVEPLGGETIVTVAADPAVIRWRVGGRSELSAGTPVRLTAAPVHLYLFDARSGEALATPAGTASQAPLPTLPDMGEGSVPDVADPTVRDRDRVGELEA
jgi:ABC-type sugar transport system ATPase subunit